MDKLNHYRSLIQKLLEEYHNLWLRRLGFGAGTGALHLRKMVVSAITEPML